MSKRLTTDEFIENSILKHGDKYNYSKAEYTRNTGHVIIICNKHTLEFSQSAASHMSGRGCPICRYESVSTGNTLTHEKFVDRATKAQGERYSYHAVEYVGTHVLVKIWCNKHSEYFLQKPINHLSGKGCPLCAKERIESANRLTKEEFVSRSNEVHKGNYSYESVEYVCACNKVKIFCKNHSGYFMQSAANHMSGSGCASCRKTGYSPNKAGILYILKSGDITKVGITNISVELRANTISRSFGAEFIVLKEYHFEDGSIPDAVETEALRYLRTLYEQPKAKFEGSSECFLSVDYQSLLSKVEELITIQKEKNGTY